MSGVTKKLMSASGGAGGGFTAIEDVFSTYLYTGTGDWPSGGVSQTIVNNINLNDEGGLVWIKSRSDSTSHALFDTERGAGKFIGSNVTSGEQTSLAEFSSFNSDGFTLGDNSGGFLRTNHTPETYASWTFRKAPRFFDVVTYTGDGVAGRTIPHNLGAEPGFIVVKITSASDNWECYHRGVTFNAGNVLWLNSANALTTGGPRFSSAPDNDNFYVGSDSGVNGSGQTYVAYLFAHDPLGPSEDGSDGLIDCGSYTGTGAAGNPITLGWEPQWVMTKRVDSTGDWNMQDIMRGMPHGSEMKLLRANLSNAESGVGSPMILPTPDGFKFENGSPGWNGTFAEYIYIAIRRGPMRAPESGTEVFANAAVTNDGLPIFTGFPVDMFLEKHRDSSSSYVNASRLAGGAKFLRTATTDAEGSFSGSFLDSNTTVTPRHLGDGPSAILHSFRRAPEFFDVVAYTGNGVAGRTVPHNLGVAPEMMIVKARDRSSVWMFYSATVGADKFLTLNSSNAVSGVDNNAWNSTNPTETNISVGTYNDVNGSGFNYIAYLFATLPGISKVGSYTGNGTSQTINCGFTSGARFIIIKRTDSTGDWYVWDTARGIVAANDPHLSLNTTAAEVTTDDSVDPDSSGFIVNQVAATNINVSAASYIFYAVA